MPSRKNNPKVRRASAYHEAGHAVVGALNGIPLRRGVTIDPATVACWKMSNSSTDAFPAPCWRGPCNRKDCTGIESVAAGEGALTAHIRGMTDLDVPEPTTITDRTALECLARVLLAGGMAEAIYTHTAMPTLDQGDRRNLQLLSITPERCEELRREVRATLEQAETWIRVVYLAEHLLAEGTRWPDSATSY